MRRYFSSCLVYFTTLELVTISLYILLSVIAWVSWDRSSFVTAAGLAAWVAHRYLKILDRQESRAEAPGA